MDRPIVFPGQLPLETDLLRMGQSAMVGLAKLSEAVLGTDTVADGFTCLPTSPASNAIVISGGSVYQRTQLESSAFSSLPPDVHQVVKQGIALDPTTLALIPPPTVGYAVNILIQVQYADSDTGAITRPYYNAANPAQPYSGPGNSGTQQPQTRAGIASIQPKYGIAAVSGSQTTPAPDTGWIGLFVVTIAYGQTAVTSGNIKPYSEAPTVEAKLPRLPSDIRTNRWTFIADSSATVNLITGSPLTPILSYATGMELKVLVGNTNTDAVTVNFGPGSRQLVRRDGTPLIAGDIVRGTVITVTDDGTKFRLNSLAQGEVPRIVPNAILWVRTDGNDNNDGSANTAASAFKTIAAAMARAAISFVTGGMGAGLTIQLGIPGTYAAPNITLRPNGNVTILGDLNDQGSYIIQGNGVSFPQLIGAAGGGSLTLNGLTLQLTGSSGAAIGMNGTINVILEKVTITSVLTTSGNLFGVGVGTVLTIRQGCIFGGNWRTLFSVNGGAVFLGNSVMTLSGTMAFSLACAEVNNAGQIVSSGASFVGSATGVRYAIGVNGIINTAGGGANFFPGSLTGTSVTGGQYV